MSGADANIPWRGYLLAYLLWATAFGALYWFGLGAQEVLYRDGDSLRHIATGDLMRTQGTATPADPWSFTSSGQDWYNPSWLFNVALSYLHEWGGTWLVTTCIALLGMVALALPVLVAERHGGTFAISILLAVLASPLFLAGIAVRPQIVTLLFTAVTVALLWQRDGQENPGVWRIFCLLVMLFFWVNGHGGWPVYFVLLGKWFTWSLIFRRKLFLFYLTAMVSSVGVPFLTPLGKEFLHNLFDFFDQQPLTAAIREWQGFDPSTHWIFLPFIIVFLVSVAVDIRLGWKHPLVWSALFWLLLALTSIRHIYIFAPLGLMSAAWLLGMQYHPRDWLARLPRVSHAQQFIALLIALAVAAIWMDATARQPLPNRYTLAKEAAWLREHEPDARLLNRYNEGGALVFALRGKPKIFIDDRAETLFPREVQADAIRFAREPGYGPQLADKVRADAVILPKHSPAAKVFAKAPGWQIAFTGPDAVVYTKRQP